MMALKTVICLNERHSNSELTHSAKLRLFHSWLSEEHKIPEAMKAVVSKELKKLGMPQKVAELAKLNEAFLKEHADSLAHYKQYLKVKNKILGEKVSDADVKIAVGVLQKDTQRNLRLAVTIDLMKKLGDAKLFKDECAKHFPNADAFKTE